MLAVASEDRTDCLDLTDPTLQDQCYERSGYVRIRPPGASVSYVTAWLANFRYGQKRRSLQSRFRSRLRCRAEFLSAIGVTMRRWPPHSFTINWPSGRAPARCSSSAMKPRTRRTHRGARRFVLGVACSHRQDRTLRHASESANARAVRDRDRPPTRRAGHSGPGQRCREAVTRRSCPTT